MRSVPSQSSLKVHVGISNMYSSSKTKHVDHIIIWNEKCEWDMRNIHENENENLRVVRDAGLNGPASGVFCLREKATVSGVPAYQAVLNHRFPPTNKLPNHNETTKIKVRQISTRNVYAYFFTSAGRSFEPGRLPVAALFLLHQAS